MAVNAQGSNTGAVKKIYQENGFEVEFRLSGQWESAYSASITLKNTGEVKIENWYIGFNLDNDITNLSSAQIYSHGENYYFIKKL